MKYRDLVKENPDLFLGDCLFVDAMQLDYDICFEHLNALRDINLQWVAHNQKGLLRSNLIIANVYGFAGYQFIIDACYVYLGSNWQDYFKPQFVEALTPGTFAFSSMVKYLKGSSYNNHRLHDTDGLRGLSEQTYGYFSNREKYHPNMKKLTTYLVFSATEEIYPAGRKADSIPACCLLEQAIDGVLNPSTPTMWEKSVSYIDSLNDGRKGVPSHFYKYVEIIMEEFKELNKPVT